MKDISLKLTVDTEQAKQKIDAVGKKAVEVGDQISKIGAGIGAAFSVANGLVGAFGEQMGVTTEQIEKAQKAATSFLSVAQGIKPVIEGATSAFKLFSAAVVANPILAVILGITAAVVALIYYWDEVTAAAREYSEWLINPAGKIMEVLEEQNEALERQRALLEKTRSEEYKRQQQVIAAGKAKVDQLQDEFRALQRLQTEIAQRYDAEIAAARALGKATGELEENKRKELKKTLEAQRDNLQAQIDAAVTTLSLARQITEEQAVALIKQDALFGRLYEQATGRVTALNNQIGDIVDAQKAQYSAASDAARKNAEDRLRIEREIIDARLANITEEGLRARQVLEENQRRELEDLEIRLRNKLLKEEEYEQLLLESKKNYAIQLGELEAETALKEEEELKKKRELQAKEDKEFADYKVQVQQEALDKTLALLDAEAQARQFLADQNVAIAQGSTELLAAIAGDNERLANVAFAIDKARAIAEVVVNTQKEIASYAANPTWSLLPDGGAALKTAASLKAKVRAALSIATIAATTIAKFKGGGGGSSSSSSGPSQTFSAPGTVATPDQRLFSTGATNEQTAAQPREQVIRAVVVESDYVATSNRLSELRRASEL
jgi:hypothetical protein